MEHPPAIRRWTSRRALLTHVGALMSVGLCAAAARWQINRAAAGNVLSYAYAVEWPLFAIAAVVMWWQLLHDDRRPRLPPLPGQNDEQAERHQSIEDPSLQAYNDELAALATGGRRKSWRNPRGLP